MPLRQSTVAGKAEASHEGSFCAIVNLKLVTPALLELPAG